MTDARDLCWTCGQAQCDCYKVAPTADPQPVFDRAGNFRADLAAVINRHSREDGSNTPDFILADYLADCLRIWDQAVMARSQWYGRHDAPGQASLRPEDAVTRADVPVSEEGR